MLRPVGIVLLAGACGARTDLVAEEPDAGPLVISDCPAALQPGAPAPVPGYCPDRANRSAYSAPSVAPELRWTLDIPVAFDATGQWIIAPRGRLYTRVNPELSDSGWVARRLLAIDDRGERGELAWSLDFEQPIATPVLLADGSLLTSTRTADGGREAIWLDADGNVMRRAPLPSDSVGHPAVASDGALYYPTSDIRVDPSERGLVAIEADGGLRWRASPVGNGTDAGIAIGLDDRPIVQDDREDAARVVALDPSDGSVIWESMLHADGTSVAGPAIGKDGSVYMVLWVDASTRTTLVVLEPDGAMRRTVDLPDPPWGGGPISLSVGGDGNAYVKAGEGYVGIGADGELLFHRAAHPNIDLESTLDAGGALLLSGTSVEALDPADGTTRWLFDPPAHEEPTPDGGTVFYFVGPATLGDGTLYFTDWGGRIYAASSAL